MHTTTRLKLPIPDETDAPPDIPAAFAAIGVPLDGLVPIDEGPLADRPISSAVSPGINGRQFVVTDQPGGNRLDVDYGTGWFTVGPVLVDQAPSVGSARTLGSGSQQAASGSDTRIVNAEQTGNKGRANGYAGLDANSAVLAPGGVEGTIANTIDIGGSSHKAARFYFGLYPGILTGGLQTDYYVSVNGTTIYSNATSFSAASDERLKENIESIEDPLSVLRSIHGRRFTWKKSGHQDHGFIAQEVREVLPELIQEADDYLVMEKAAMVAPLWEACRALLDRVETLEAKLEAKT